MLGNRPVCASKQPGHSEQLFLQYNSVCKPRAGGQQVRTPRTMLFVHAACGLEADAFQLMSARPRHAVHAARHTRREANTIRNTARSFPSYFHVSMLHRTLLFLASLLLQVSDFYAPLWLSCRTCPVYPFHFVPWLSTVPVSGSHNSRAVKINAS